MAILQGNSLDLAFGERQLLAKVVINVGQGDRIALAGANGSGKSTLLRILAGQTKPDSGDVTKTTGTKVAYLAQTGVEFRATTIWLAADQAFAGLADLEGTVANLSHELSIASPDQVARLADALHQAQEGLEDSGYYQRQGRIQAVLTGLGFQARQFHDSVETLSGGWQMRLALAKILLESPDILLLDEPTNYLDLETRAWLLDWLKRFPGGLVIVSHDRFVLDNLATSVAELYQSKLKLYPGTYTQYEARRQLELEQIIAAWKKQQTEIEHLERFVERFGAKATKASQAQSRVKQLEKIERIEIPDGLKRVHFRFPPPPSSGETVLTLAGVGQAYGAKTVLRDLDFTLARGKKLAIMGPNGAGKSTLLRIIAGVEAPKTGSARLGHQVVRSYFAQEAETSLTLSNQIIEEIEAVAPTEVFPQIRSLLGAFLFQDDDVYKPISVLSGGERSRVALVKMLLTPANLLILDEPTNHLDLTSKDILLDALKDFPGTIVFVSHDRYFIRDLADSVLALTPQENSPAAWHTYDGGLEYYEWIQAKAAAKVGDEAEKPGPTVAVASDNKLRREADKRQQAQVRKLERAEGDLVAQIEATEAELAACHTAMATPEYYTNPTRLRACQAEVVRLEAEVERHHAAWEAIVAELETVKS